MDRTHDPDHDATYIRDRDTAEHHPPTTHDMTDDSSIRTESTETEPIERDRSKDTEADLETHAPLTRRRVVAGGAALAATALAGCSDDEHVVDEPEADDGDPTDDEGSDDADEDAVPDLPQVEDPPEAAYLPTHFEAMEHIDPVVAGEYEVEGMVTYPHLFWNVTGEEVEAAEPAGTDVHLMATVRDPETGTILPAETGLEMVVAREGEEGTPHAPWPMISQEMGFHVGDNVPLGDDGTYEVEVRVGAIEARKTGEFAGRFEEPGTGTFTFEFDDEFRREVVAGIHYLDEEHWGAHGSLANHVAGHEGHDEHNGDGHDDHSDHDDRSDHDDGSDHDGHGGHHHDDADGDPHHPGDSHHDHHGDERWDEGEGHHRFGTYLRGGDEGELPAAAELPGELLGEPVIGDALLATTVLDRGSRFVEDDEYYLAVSPRTPYNRSMLPMMALTYELRRDGETVESDSLRDTLDHELGYHYAAPLADLEEGDELVVTIDTPTNASRHAGYETAFLETGDAELEVRLP